MQLLADRFVVIDMVDGERRAIDLSTGDDVTLIVSAPGGPSDQMRWSVRCGQLFRLHHRAIARLVDYDLLGETSRFEAWRCGPPWAGATSAAARALSHAQIFLRANCVTEGQLSLAHVRTDRGRAVVLPDRATGYDTDGAARGVGTVGVEACGLNTIERPSVAALAEIVTHAGGARPQVLALRAGDEAGASSAVRHLARVARQHGLVPLALHVPAHSLLDVLRGRTLFLIDRRGGRQAWQRLVEWTLLSPKPHVLLSVGPHEVPHARGLQLGAIPEEAFVNAVTPAVAMTIRRAVERAARQSRGLPARFAEALWGPPAATVRVSRPPRRSIAAEQPAVYGEEPTSAPAGLAPSWPAPEELGTLRTRLNEAIDMMDRGRHAPAERALRAAVGSLARRHDWHDAARGLLALASSLLKRGRARDVHGLLAEAQTYAAKTGEEALLLGAAIAAGHAHLDQGRLDEAESTLHAAFGAARSGGEPTMVLAAGVAVARCLFWRGKYSEADAVLQMLEPADDHGGEALQLDVVRSRVAVGRGDIGRAISHATRADEGARRSGRASVVADAAYALAFAHLWTGDLPAVERDVASCLRASRAARHPLRALKARIIAAEAARRSGRTALVKPLLARVARVRLPATVRARLALLGDLVSSAPADAVKRHVAATGLPALALFAPSEANHSINSAMETAVDVLRLCQAADEEAVVLPAICGRIRPRLQATGVAFFAREGDSSVSIAADGTRVEAAIATRVIDACQPIPPYQHNERIEGGVPVRYGGDTLGALVARWTIGSPPETALAQMILTMTATAAGPALAAVLARRRQPATGGVGELLGASGAIADLRAAVERAAAAPFAVLIEGESGSGKELVARALHRRGPRRDRPFCTLNCAALPDDLVEAELFGHSRGAFTGAVAERAGVFEESHQGTLLLDEIGELSLRAQAKVLRTIQEGEVRRVGENLSRRIDVRIVAATNRDLRQDVAANRFRLDLLYRLDVIRITVPPLRDRREDVALLAEQFWRDATGRVGSRAVLSAATVAALARYDWPGNVRELQNVLAALAVRSPKRGVIPPTALPPCFGVSTPAGTWRLGEARRTFEERFIRAALVRAGGHRSRAAEELGLSRQGLAKLMSRLQIAD